MENDADMGKMQGAARLAGVMLCIRRSAIALAFAAGLFAHAAAYATSEVGSPAPNFAGVDSNGKSHQLSDYRGKFVVLEWTNKDCPYTRKHYISGNMQALQKQWEAKGVVWLTILSSAEGQEGYMTGAEENAYMSKVHAEPTAAILDPEGKIGRGYEAKTTPHMFVIDPAGKLIYKGAIDDHPTTHPEDIKRSTNYVSKVLGEAMTGKPVSTPFSPAYGCGVKYANGD